MRFVSLAAKMRIKIDNKNTSFEFQEDMSSVSSSASSRAAILSQWDRIDSPLAPVSNSQRQVVADLSAIALKSFPPRAMTNEDVHDKYEDIEDNKDDSSMTETSQGSVHSSSNGLLPAVKKVETGHQFLEWLHQVEDNLQYQEDAPYRSYIQWLQEQCERTHNMITRLGDALSALSKLDHRYDYVKTQSNALHEACQHLLSEQNQLSDWSDEVSKILVYYSEADKISQKLTSPTLSVYSESFLRILSQIDECLIFIDEHNDFKQTAVYKVRYQASLSRALNMIRTNVKNAFEKATTTSLSSSEQAITLFYGKFRAAAPRVAPLMHQVEARSSRGFETTCVPGITQQRPSPLWQDYETLLTDCQSSYIESRDQLITPSVQSGVAELVAHHSKDHGGLLRAGCSFLLRVCDDEYQLYHQFFHSSSSGGLDLYLESLCQILYDTLRPLIIHLQHLETLSDLTGILRSEVQGVSKLQPHLSLSYLKIMNQLLQDVQERLVYRASIYIRTDIAGYVPGAGDLAYPEKLEMMQSIADSLKVDKEQEEGPKRERKISTNSSSSMEVAHINSMHSPADFHGMWYPPLRRTLVCLSKLYRCLDRGIFQGLSQEALSACIDSIAKASGDISQKKSPIDGQLFEIKHLLILREQIAPFQVDFSVKELSLDFTKLKTAAYSLFSNKNLWELSSNNALLELILETAAPEVRETCVDSRKEVDKRLKAVCQAFIYHVTVIVVGPIKSFLTKCEEFKKIPTNSNLISSQPWAQVKDLQDKVSICQRQLKKYFPEVQRSMQIYLANKETEFILFRPIRNNVISAFINFFQISKTSFTADEQVIIGCPSQEQISMLISSLQLQPK